jgi:hypothetical protein
MQSATNDRPKNFCHCEGDRTWTDGIVSRFTRNMKRLVDDAQPAWICLIKGRFPSTFPLPARAKRLLLWTPVTPS